MATQKQQNIIDRINQAQTQEITVKLGEVDLKLVPLKAMEMVNFMKLMGEAMRQNKPLIEMMDAHFPDFQGSSVAKLEDDSLLELISLFIKSAQS